MNRTLHDEYLDYLEPQIGPDLRDSYRDLITLLYQKEFVWFVPNDDNRIVDGLDLRAEWVDHALEVVGPPVRIDHPCSFLEVMIGLSRRMGFMAGESSEGWCWQLLVNLGLHGYKDPLSRYKLQRADDIAEVVIWRTYEPDGTGGFFPLTHPLEDQRKIELWYQMSAYIEEIHPEY